MAVPGRVTCALQLTQVPHVPLCWAAGLSLPPLPSVPTFPQAVSLVSHDDEKLSDVNGCEQSGSAMGGNDI